MKKVSKKELIKLLKNKDNYTYKELAKLTGYHPKSLIRLNSKLKQNNYILKNNNKAYLKMIFNAYINGNYKSYQEFYNKHKYKISYSTLSKMFKNIKIDKEIVFIRKIKNKGNYYFEVIDYKTASILFNFNSLKNDKKSFKKILNLLLKNFGAPTNISFINFYKSTPLEIQNLLNKYNIKTIIFKSIYRNVFTNLSSNTKNIHYKKITIAKEDFYNSRVIKTISNNIVQFKNTRYIIKYNNLINKNEIVILFYDTELKDLFIKYKSKLYELIPYKKIESKKGNSKYN